MSPQVRAVEKEGAQVSKRSSVFPRRSGKGSKSRRELRTALVLLLPAVIFLGALLAYPLLQQLLLSLSDSSLLRPDEGSFVGLDNYREILADEGFYGTIRITSIYVATCVVGSLAVGLGIAVLLNRPFKGRGLARALITIPWAAPRVAVALLFVWIYNPSYGIFNYLLGLDNVEWLTSADRALVAVLLTTLWQIFPFVSVVLLAALQGVPAELKEAAALDGANAIQRFGVADWPFVRGSVLLMGLFATIWALRRFDLIWLMTQGGPVGATNTLVVDLYRRAFIYRDLGTASAVGMIGVAIATVATCIYLIATREREASK